MVAVTDTSPDAETAPAAVDGASASPVRNIGVVPTASLLTGAAIATALHISVGSAEKHIASIFTKLDLAPDESENRRVLAVLRYLES